MFFCGCKEERKMTPIELQMCDIQGRLFKLYGSETVFWYIVNDTI